MDGNSNGLSKLLKIKLAVGGAAGCASVFFIALPLIVVVFLVLGLFGDGSSSGGSTCINIKSASEICKSITVSGYGTMSVDDYVAGVVEHEFGGANLETKKAQAVAARSYGLHGASKDNNGNCVITNTSEGFQTYSNNPSETSIQAANETSGIILVDENGNVARSEYSSNSLPQPYNSYGGTITMSERNLQIPRDWWNSHKTCSDSDLNTPKKEKDAYGRTVYGCGHGRGMGQIAAWYLSLEKGYTYDQILDFFYGSESEYNWSLASTKSASSNCTSSNNGNFQTLSTYNIGHSGLKILNSPLSSSDISNLNDYIDKEINKAGYGTGEAVAAAGQSLAYGLEQLGYYLGYCWGGDRSSMGVGTSWGSNSSSCDSPTKTHEYYGMDCSGFVSWAIRNACKPGYSATTYQMDYGSHISAKDAKPGDLMLDTDSHVRLVVKNNGDGTVVTVESGGAYDGVAFSEHGDESGYNYIDMSSWYSKNCSTK